MALDPSALRARVATAVAALGAPWKESRWSYPVFPGPPGDTRDFSHLAFAIGVPTTNVERLDRQSQAFNAVVQTALGVRFLHRLRADNHVSDYDDALTAEIAMIGAVMGSSQLGGQVILVGVTDRVAVADGTYFFGQVLFRVVHTLTI